MSLILKPIIGIVVNGGALYIMTLVVDGITYTGGIKFFVIGGIIVGLINSFVKPLIKIFAFPFVLISGGLFLIVINAGVLWFLSYFLQVVQFQNVTIAFPNLGAYVIGAVVFGIINWILHLID